MTLAQQDVENTSRSVVKVLIPATQLQGFLRSITDAANKIKTQVQEQAEISKTKTTPTGKKK